MPTPRKAALKTYARNVPYTSISLTLPARDKVRSASAILTGKLGRRVGISETLVAVLSVVDWNAAARKLEGKTKR